MNYQIPYHRKLDLKELNQHIMNRISFIPFSENDFYNNTGEVNCILLGNLANSIMKHEQLSKKYSLDVFTNALVGLLSKIPFVKIYKSRTRNPYYYVLGLESVVNGYGGVPRNLMKFSDLSNCDEIDINSIVHENYQQVCDTSPCYIEFLLKNEKARASTSVEKYEFEQERKRLIKEKRLREEIADGLRDETGELMPQFKKKMGRKVTLDTPEKLAAAEKRKKEMAAKRYQKQKAIKIAADIENGVRDSDGNLINTSHMGRPRTKSISREDAAERKKAYNRQYAANRRSEEALERKKEYDRQYTANKRQELVDYQIRNGVRYPDGTLKPEYDERLTPAQKDELIEAREGVK